jgi:hypothetical protein
VNDLEHHHRKPMRGWIYEFTWAATDAPEPLNASQDGKPYTKIK